MELIKQHISPCLHSFVNEMSSTFEDDFNKVQNDLSIDFVGLIRYLDNLLNEVFLTSNDSIAVLHIHIEDEFNDLQKLFIAEFLCIKTFMHYHSTDNITNEANFALIELIAAYETKLNALEMRCPDGASGKNGGNRIWKNWVKEKKEYKSLLEFYKSLNESSTLKPKFIINTKKNFCSLVSQKFEFKPYCVLINSKNISHNLLNASQTLNEIDAFNNEIIDELDSIVLFDCERKSLMSNFSLEEINKWNSDYNTNFKQYLLFTFGSNILSINSIRNKIDTIRERFKIPEETTYTILSSEIDFLLKAKNKSIIPIEFIGKETSSFWDSFHLETSIRNLYELRSIKLMNIYSLCLTKDIKNYILDDLFSSNESSELVSFNTKQTLIELQDDDINILKEALSNILDLIISLGMKSIIKENLNGASIIILDDGIVKNQKFTSKFLKALEMKKTINIKTWSTISRITSNKIIILSYRDQGKYPNYYYPNLVEYEFDKETIASAILPNFFFGSYYNWSKYNLLEDYYKYLSHPIRFNHFGWNQLKSSIHSLRPELKQNIDWNLEYEFSNSEQRETYRIKVKGQRIKTFNSSDFLIYSEESCKNHRIERVKWLFDNLDFEEAQYNIQKLDDLLNEFNPADKLIDTTQQELELEIIRNQLGLGNEKAGRIWKILLSNKSKVDGVKSLYEELKLIFAKNKIPLVSINHFRNSWINIESDSLMPRGNKVFKILCEYLGLNNNYRLILYRIKNASISGKIEATKKYSNLLKDLFADRCFDNNASIQTILQSRIKYYRNNHSLDELGIDYENPLNGLITLIDLIQPELKLTKLETIEKLSNE